MVSSGEEEKFENMIRSFLKYGIEVRAVKVENVSLFEYF